MLSFFEHISVSESPLVKASLSESKFLSIKGKSSWFNSIERILDFGGLGPNMGQVEETFKKIYKDKWERERLSSLNEGKLGILARCKKEFALSPYLESTMFPSYKRALAKFRTSAHKLPIEIERYSNTPRSARVCIFGCDAIGDEAHYLLECKNPGIREVYLPYVNKIFSDDRFTKMNNESKMIFILSEASNALMWTSGKLCYKVLARYKEITG